MDHQPIIPPYYIEDCRILKLWRSSIVFVFGYEKEGSFVLKRLGKVLAISFLFLASEFDRTICIVLVRCHFQTVKKCRYLKAAWKPQNSERRKGLQDTYLLMGSSNYLFEKKSLRMSTEGGRWSKKAKVLSTYFVNDHL